MTHYFVPTVRFYCPSRQLGCDRSGRQWSRCRFYDEKILRRLRGTRADNTTSAELERPAIPNNNTYRLSYTANVVRACVLCTGRQRVYVTRNELAPTNFYRTMRVHIHVYTCQTTNGTGASRVFFVWCACALLLYTHFNFVIFNSQIDVSAASACARVRNVPSTHIAKSRYCT